MALSAVTSGTVPQRFWQWAGDRGDRTMLRQKELGIWQARSWRQVAELVADLAAGLASLGVRAGEAVGILANTSKEWVFADLAAQMAGAVVCGLHATDSSRQVQSLCAAADIRVLFVENEEQLDKVLGDGREPSRFRHIVAFQMEGLHQLEGAPLLSLEELARRGAEARKADGGLIERLLRSRRLEDVATLVYTSGSTGEPKPAMLSHGNILAACDAMRSALFEPLSTRAERVLFLPLSHVMERIGGEYLNMMLGAVMNFVENAETVFENVREVQPDVFIAVPRVWERLYSSLAIALHDATALQRWAYARAIGWGRQIAEAEERGRKAGFGLRARYRLARVLVLDNLRRMMGLDRIRFAITGAAPISAELIRWYRAMGVDLREIWGLSEASGAVTATAAGAPAGSIGKPLPSIEVRLSERGEILVRGPTVFGGYGNESLPSGRVLADGWLHTGDLGRLDDAGHLYITDRIDDIIVTLRGDKVGPSELENRLKFSPYVTDAVVVGEGRSDLACLLMIDQENVGQWAQDRRVPFSDYRSLCASREVIELIAAEVEKANAHAGERHRIKAFRLIDAPAGVDEDQLTPTMKLKRRRVVESYADVIEAMYATRAA
jgi:long-chain acyl-CoA synthetase